MNKKSDGIEIKEENQGENKELVHKRKSLSISSDENQGNEGRQEEALEMVAFRTFTSDTETPQEGPRISPIPVNNESSINSDVPTDPTTV